MIKRLGFGLTKGLLIGGLIGGGLQFGVPSWTVVSGVIGFLIAMGVAGTAGVFAGKAPWLDGAWIEAALKGLVGVGLGALAYWGLTFAPFSIPFPGLEGTHVLAALPALYAPAIAGVYGALVELDNTGEEKASKGSKGPKARVAIDDADAEEEGVSRREKKKRRNA